MTEEIIPDSRALLVKDGGVKLLVIADLHLTDENEIVYPIIERIKALAKKHKPAMIVVNGDLFNFGTGGASADIFEQEVSKIADLKILMGNHDPEIFPLFLCTKNYCISHGDMDYKQPQKNLILAHTHPFLKENPVFLKGELSDGRRFTVLPTFNTEEKGPEIEDKEQLLGFIFRKDLIKDCIVYNLKGEKIAKLNY